VLQRGRFQHLRERARLPCLRRTSRKGLWIQKGFVVHLRGRERESALDPRPTDPKPLDLSATANADRFTVLAPDGHLQVMYLP